MGNMRGTSNLATGMSLEVLVDLGGLQVRSPEDQEAQGCRDVAFRKFLVPLALQVDILGTLWVSNQVDTENPVDKGGRVCLDTQEGIKILDST